MLHATLMIQSGGTEEEMQSVVRCFEHRDASVEGWAIRSVTAIGVMAEVDVSSRSRRELDRAIEELRGLRSVRLIWVVDHTACMEA